MIFVTVGTHEQPFNRLLEQIDKLVENGVITEEVIVQSGFCTYKPEHCIYQKLFTYTEMEKYVLNARIIITHGGPSSFLMPLKIGKIPIVTPRKFKFGEHINDHQVNFSHAVASRIGNIIVVEDMEKIEEVIKKYNDIVSHMMAKFENNNDIFCKQFERIVENLFEGMK